MSNQEDATGAAFVGGLIVFVSTSSILYGLPMFFKGYNCMFFGLLNGILVFAALIQFDQYQAEFEKILESSEKWFLMLGLIFLVLGAFYFAEHDYRPHRRWVDTTPLFSSTKTGHWEPRVVYKVDNLLAAGIWGLLSAISVLGLAGSVEIFKNIKAAKKMRADTQQQSKSQSSSSNKTKEEAFAGSKASGNRSGSQTKGGFDFDPSAFKTDPNAPRGYEKRHPDDAKLWAQADDPANPPEVRKSFFNKIMEREAKRNDD